MTAAIAADPITDPTVGSCCRCRRRRPPGSSAGCGSPWSPRAPTCRRCRRRSGPRAAGTSRSGCRRHERRVEHQRSGHQQQPGPSRKRGSARSSSLPANGDSTPEQSHRHQEQRRLVGVRPRPSWMKNMSGSDMLVTVNPTVAIAEVRRARSCGPPHPPSWSALLPGPSRRPLRGV